MMRGGLQNGSTPAAIVATATALPPFCIGRDEVKHYLGKVFAIEPARLEAMMSVIDNSQVRQRYCINPVEKIIAPRPLGEITREYQQQARVLGAKVAAQCLARAALTPRDIDMLITVSCTGVMIPSLDAYLINEMGFRNDVRRLPITELGCAAGAAAAARAADFIRAYPGSKVLVIAVELPSLTFQRGNVSQANLISTVLFGDGAAAAILREAPPSGPLPLPRVIDTRSHLFPDTLDGMGFDLKETGFHIVLSKDIPQLIKESIRELTETFLAPHGLNRQDLKAFVLHPGGQKLLACMEEELALLPADTEYSWKVLRECGNLSSASVIFVLDEWLRNRRLAAGEYGLMAAFGPGFSAELLLLQWQ